MISFAIDAFATPLVVTRTTESTTFVDGIAVPTTEEQVFDVVPVSVQPMTAHERQLLPELIRDREVLKAYTRCELRTVDVANKVKADRITYREQEWVVNAVQDWSELGGFWKAILVREDD